MKSIYPVSFQTAPTTKELGKREEVSVELQEVFSGQAIWFELVLADGLTFTCFGTRNTLTLRQIEEGKEKAFCLAKRKQTFHQLEAAGKSVEIPHHQILQKEDAEMILLSILEGRDVPDAYHLEDVTS